MMLCQHEETAVQIAHGYAKASGKPMVAILHNLVGLLHANMAIYYAYADRAPVFIIGATGPMDETKRRPRIDWIHTALVQGEAVRAYTKWDYQPTVIDGVPESFARAYRVMMTEPRGPIYMCYDAWLQEQPLEQEVPLADEGLDQKVPSRLAPDPAALKTAADMLLDGEAAGHPRRVRRPRPGGLPRAGRAGRDARRAGLRRQQPPQFPEPPSAQPEHGEGRLRATPISSCAWIRATGSAPPRELVSATREVTSIVPAGCKWIDIGFGDLEISSWAMDYQRLAHADLRILADTTLAIPALTELLKPKVDKARAAETAKAAAALWSRRRAASGKPKRRKTGTRARSRCRAWPREVWQAIKDEDWVLTANTLEEWTRKIWDFDRPYRHPGKSLGTATQIGISLGVALAHRDARRLVVDMQPDGDLMFDAGALWVAAKHRIPLLVVMYNNRAYYNDWEHQIRMAKLRGTPVERAYIGMDMDDPAPDFAALAQVDGLVRRGPDRPAG